MTPEQTDHDTENHYTSFTDPLMDVSESKVQEQLANGGYELSDQNRDLSDDRLANTIVDYILGVIATNPLNTAPLISLLAAPGSGKNYLTDKAQTKFLAKNGRSLVVIDADGFLIGSSQERRNTELSDANITDKYHTMLFLRKIKEAQQLRPGERMQLPFKVPKGGLALNSDGTISDERSFVVQGPSPAVLVIGDVPLWPLENLIYLHVPEDIRLGLSIDRSTSGTRLPEETRQIFHERLQKQHIPFTLPELPQAEVIILAQISDKHPVLTYDVHTKKTN